MTIHTITVGRHKLVCGLFWQSLSRPRELALEARALALKIDADLMVLRKDHTMAQAGYAHTRDGARRGQASFACVVAARLAQEPAFCNGQRQAPHNWLGAFRLADGMWAYVAVRDLNFLPSGDFAGTREQVLERLHGDYALGGWNRVAGEPELEGLGFHDFVPLGLDTLLAPGGAKPLQSPRWARLDTVRQPARRRLWMVGAASACALALAAGALYQRHSAQQLRELQQQAFEAMQRDTPPAPPPPPPPWHAQAPATDLVRRCMARLRHLAPGGWELEQFQCAGDSALHTWRRGESHLGLLLAALPEAQIDASGERASLSEALEPGTLRSEDLVPGAQARRALQELWQRLGLTGQVVEQPPPATPGTDGVAPPPPPWTTHTVSVALDRLAPQALPAMLDMPGLRISNITYRAGAWSLEGVLYAK